MSEQQSNIEIRPGEEKFVHNPAEAEEMAYAEKPHRDYAVEQLNPLINAQKDAMEEFKVAHPQAVYPDSDAPSSESEEYFQRRDAAKEEGRENLFFEGQILANGLDRLKRERGVILARGREAARTASDEYRAEQSKVVK